MCVTVVGILVLGGVGVGSEVVVLSQLSLCGVVVSWVRACWLVMLGAVGLGSGSSGTTTTLAVGSESMSMRR